MKRIYARKTTIKKITDEQANNFISKYHRQGLCSFGKERYDIGLFYNNELVGEASFSNPRTKAKARKYQQELVRMTFKSDVQVIGGASKLIKYYINDFKPRNFFTYQTMTGQQSNVYKLSGMTLRNKGKAKRLLIKNGYTYETALNEHKEQGTNYLYLNAQLVNLGPDKLLKTSIGEQFDNDGNRLTNEQLFIDYCDYHVEMIDGDNVYDYNNDNYLHYIYKITNDNINDDKYYLGRHSVYTDGQEITITDLIQDGYMGSGGKKFQNWKNKTKSDGYKLIKTILSTQTTWISNIKAEEKAIGILYKTDENCLNSTKGGIDAHVSNSITYLTKTCPIHGETIFRNDTCCKCSYQKSINEGICKIHGKTKFRRNHCLKCLSSKSIHTDYCDIHGNTLFNGRQCLKCQNNQQKHIQHCDIHGDTLFFGNKCCKCTSQKGLSEQYCNIHGMTQFRNDQCLACQVNNYQLKIKECPIHGMTNFKGDTCLKCSAEQRITTQYCKIHGYTKFSGDTCVKCVNNATFTEKECPIHGMTKFKGAKCCKCSASESYHEKECPIHGMTLYQGNICLKCKNNESVSQKWCDKCQKVTGWNGNTCMSCTNKKMNTIKECPIHGQTKFRGNTCMKCAQAKRKKKPKKVHVTEYKYCDKCDKKTRYVDGKCMSCKERALYHQDTCEIHGLTKFRGKKCCACRAEKMREQRRLKKLNKN